MSRVTNITKRTGQIAVTDEPGQRHLVDEFTRFTRIEFASAGDPPQTAQGSRYFRLGPDTVNYVDEDTFEDPHTGEVFTRLK